MLLLLTVTLLAFTQDVKVTKITDNTNTIETVIPGHGGLWDKESLQLHYEYFTDMFEMVDKMVNEGGSLEAAIENLSLDKGFSHVSSLQNLSDNDKERHLKNVEIFWNYIESSEMEN